MEEARLGQQYASIDGASCGIGDGDRVKPWQQTIDSGGIRDDGRPVIMEWWIAPCHGQAYPSIVRLETGWLDDGFGSGARNSEANIMTNDGVASPLRSQATADAGISSND